MSATQSKLWYLEKIDLLKGLRPEELQRVADRTTVGHAHKDEHIYFPEEPSNVVFFLKRGRVKIATMGEDGKEVIKAVLYPGEVFGELGAAGEEKRRDHAVALDDRRAFFRTNLAATPEGRDVRQIWFAGAHADVGGGYKEAKSGLSRIALGWMLQEAEQYGLLTDDVAKAGLLRQIAVDTERDELSIHDSLTWKWWLAEFVPKRRYDATTGRKGWRINLFGRRDPGADPLLHDSVWLLSGYEIPPGSKKASEVWPTGVG